MPFAGLALFTIFPVLAARRFRDGGVRSLGTVVLLGWVAVTVIFLIMEQPAPGTSGVIEVLAYGLIWTLPLLLASAAILVSARFKVSSVTQMALAYVTECLAIAPTLW